MTPEQQATFIRAAQLGIVCGLTHRYEWFVNADRALLHGSYGEIPEHSVKLLEAFVEFERGTCDGPEDEAFMEALDGDGFIKLVNAYYKEAYERRQLALGARST